VRECTKQGFSEHGLPSLPSSSCKKKTIKILDVQCRHCHGNKSSHGRREREYERYRKVKASISCPKAYTQLHNRVKNKKQQENKSLVRDEEKRQPRFFISWWHKQPTPDFALLHLNSLTTTAVLE
jgi:hypothetical protein